jgi:hypothetical protein
VWSAATVFVCALELLGRSAASFPPVQFVEKVPTGISSQVAGYVLAGEGRIVVITSTDAFTRARQSKDRCNDLDALREVAGVLAHEEWHVRHGPDEEGAYDAQLIALLSAGAHEDSALFHKIKQAKLAVAAASRRRADMGRSARGAPVDDGSQRNRP